MALYAWPGGQGARGRGATALGQPENRELEPQLPGLGDFFNFCHFPTFFPCVTTLLPWAVVN